jgi:L-aminopeptidase/D-esterase-like protein
MKSFRVGHFSDPQKGTGVSVILLDKPSPASYLLCGASPASSELHVLDLEANVPYIDGLMLGGGSVFGLQAVGGVRQWFKEQNRGYQTRYSPIPIIPAATIYDLGQTSSEPPTAQEGYQACLNASYSNFAQGRVGAGTGATIGKIVPNTTRMSGGLGYAELKLKNGLCVAAYAVVNCLGDVINQSGEIIAGATLPNGKFANTARYLEQGNQEICSDTANTTLVAILTNAAFSKVQLKRISKVALSGMAKSISPVFTQYDGDIIFCVSTGAYQAAEITMGAMAAEVVRQAIVNSVKNSIRV